MSTKVKHAAPSAVEPAFVSIEDAANFTGECVDDQESPATRRSKSPKGWASDSRRVRRR